MFHTRTYVMLYRVHTHTHTHTQMHILHILVVILYVCDNVPRADTHITHTHHAHSIAFSRA